MTESFSAKTKISDDTKRSEAAAASFSSPVRVGKAATPMSSPSMGSGFSPDKQSALRSFLLAKGTTKVKPTKPVSIDESKFLKMISPSKSGDSKALIQQVKHHWAKMGDRQGTPVVPPPLLRLRALSLSLSLSLSISLLCLFPREFIKLCRGGVKERNCG